MNIYRFIGVLGLITGSTALLLICISASGAEAWIPETIAIQWQDQIVQNLLGGIGAITSGTYLLVVGQS